MSNLYDSLGLKGASLEEVKRYRDVDALNQSFLKRIRERPRSEKKDTDAGIWQGRLLETTMLTPDWKDDLFYVLPEGLSIGDGEKLVGETLFQINPNIPNTPGAEKEFEQAILKAFEIADYQRNWKDETKVSKFFSTNIHKAYFMAKDCAGKTVITKEDELLIDEAKVNASLQQVMDWFRGIYQVPIYLKLEVPLPDGKTQTFRFKVLLDILHYDAENKKITIRDTKWTAYRLENFKYEATKYRLDYQMAFYYWILTEYLRENELTDITVEYPELLVYSGSDRRWMKFELTENDLYIGKWGFHYKTEHRTNNAAIVETSKVCNGFMDDIYYYALTSRQDVEPHLYLYYRDSFVRKSNFWAD